jgi:hypothetical protein
MRAHDGVQTVPRITWRTQPVGVRARRCGAASRPGVAAGEGGSLAGAVTCGVGAAKRL